MKMIDGKTYYTWSDYAKDMRATDWIKCDHVVAVYRGSLGMACHISNMKDIPMSIVGFQTRDGDDKKPYWIHNATEADTSWLDNSEGKHILVGESGNMKTIFWGVNHFIFKMVIS